jgi:hypothetical protein
MNRTLATRASAAFGALALGALALCQPALAARPQPGASYIAPRIGPIELTQIGSLLVSRDGRRIVADGSPYSGVQTGLGPSYVGMDLRCRLPGESFERTMGAYFQLGGGDGIPVSRNGRFRASARAESYFSDRFGPDVATVELRGVFTKNGEVLVKVVAGQVSPYFGHGASCPVAPKTIRFGVRPMPPYKSCRTARGRTIVSSRSARIFSTWGADEDGPGSFAYGCLVGGRRAFLGRMYSEDDEGIGGGIDQFKLAGQYAAWFEHWHVEFANEAETIAVVDLARGGRAVHVVSGPFSTWQLSRKGSLAWIKVYCPTQRCGNDDPRMVEVWVADAGGRRRLDSGTDIDYRSLTVDGSTVVWTRGGVHQRAPLVEL